jgi:Flp pilus assembly pilin Flp
MRIMRFLRDDLGQDLIDYTLLLGFIALTSAALFIHTGSSVSGIWNAANSQLATASSTSGASSPSSSPTSPTSPTSPSDPSHHGGHGGGGHGGDPWGGGHGGGGGHRHF